MVGHTARDAAFDPITFDRFDQDQAGIENLRLTFRKLIYDLPQRSTAALFLYPGQHRILLKDDSSLIFDERSSDLFGPITLLTRSPRPSSLLG